MESADSAAADELLPPLAAGEEIGTAGLIEDSARWDADDVATEATEPDGRASSSKILLGSSTVHRDRLAGQLGLRL